MANKKVTKETVMSSIAQRTEEVTAAVKAAAKVVGDKAEEVVADASEAIAAAAKDAETKETAPKAEEAQPEKKAAAEKKEKAPRKTKAKAAKPAKKEAAEAEIFVQFGANESALAGVVDKIKAEYVDQGHRASSIKSLKVYLKPEDGAAYYVINDKLAGRVDLF